MGDERQRNRQIKENGLAEEHRADHGNAAEERDVERLEHRDALGHGGIAERLAVHRAGDAERQDIEHQSSHDLARAHRHIHPSQKKIRRDSDNTQRRG